MGFTDQSSKKIYRENTCSVYEVIFNLTANGLFTRPRPPGQVSPPTCLPASLAAMRHFWSRGSGKHYTH